MSVLESVPEKLGSAEPFIEKGGVHWLTLGALNVRQLAEVMNSLHARFITITAYQLPKEEGFRLEYHWDLDGQLLGFPIVLTGNSIESIFDLCEAADWIEREIHEEYSLEFTGREYEPLLLRQGDETGVNLRDGVASSNAVAAK
ncbi:MAG: NADH-quinone oxidoreductase subunit C [Terracidiphilus sp.]